MANHRNALKAIRQTIKRTERNRARRNRIRSFVKQVELAIQSKDKDAAKAAFRAAESELARGVTKGVLKKKTASRKISRLAKKVKNIDAAQASA